MVGKFLKNAGYYHGYLKKYPFCPAQNEKALFDIILHLPRPHHGSEKLTGPAGSLSAPTGKISSAGIAPLRAKTAPQGGRNLRRKRTATPRHAPGRPRVTPAFPACPDAFYVKRFMSNFIEEA